MSKECARCDPLFDGSRTYSGAVNAHGSGHVFLGDRNVGQINDMRQFYIGKTQAHSSRRSDIFGLKETRTNANGQYYLESSNSFPAIEYLAQGLGTILRDIRLLLRDIEVDDSGREALDLAAQRYAKVNEDLQALRERWLQIEENSASSTERREMSSQLKDIKTRIKADTFWLTMKHTEYTQ
jgi:hypothetical protein